MGDRKRHGRERTQETGEGRRRRDDGERTQGRERAGKGAEGERTEARERAGALEKSREGEGAGERGRTGAAREGGPKETK